MNWRWSALIGFSLPFALPSMAMTLEIQPSLLVNAAAPSQLQNGTLLSWTGKTAFGGGLQVSYHLGDTGLVLESGAVLMKDASERTSTTALLVRENSRMHYPLILRYQFDDRFGIGLGGYYSSSIGSIISNSGNNSTMESHSSAGIREEDFGLLLSARASIPIIAQFRLVIDGRYLHGLSNNAAIPPGIAGDYLNTRFMQAYLGISWVFSTES